MPKKGVIGPNCFDILKVGIVWSHVYRVCWVRLAGIERPLQRTGEVHGRVQRSIGFMWPYIVPIAWMKSDGTSQGYVLILLLYGK